MQPYALIAMAHSLQSSDDLRLLLLPATRRDGEITGALFQRAGISVELCRSSKDLAAKLAESVGAIVLTDTFLSDPHIELLIFALKQQPAWSDVPVILLGRNQIPSSASARILETLTNVTLLDRPTSTRSLLSAVEAALRGRARQYQLRDQLHALNEAERANQRATDALRTADQRKDEFLAMLAHELRNPLSPILTAADYLARALPAQEQIQNSIGIVKRQAIQLTRLVDDLLDISRITQNRIQLNLQPHDIQSVIHQSVESVEPLLHSKHHRLTLDIAAEPLFVSGDRARLVQCVANVLTNAAKYTDPGGDIRIAVRQDHSSVVTTITDSGVGMSAELVPQIFDLFVQSNRSLDRSQGGLGVGLSVVRRLVQMHEGTVTARSDGPDQGSTFEIRLPMIATPVTIEVPTLPREPLMKRVLVVDDNLDAAAALEMLLQLSGHVVLVRNSAAEAILAARDFKPDVILLDIGLPTMDGYEVTKRIRASGSRAVMIALTGYGQDEDVKRALAAGFDAHLVKPADIDALERLILIERTA